MQYPRVIYLKVTITPNMRMDRREQRRLALKSLIDSLGRGGVAAVAGRIGKAPDYVSRMLYEPGKEGKKGIGEDTWDVLVAAYPKELMTKSEPATTIREKRTDPEIQVADLQRQVDSLTVVLASLVSITAKHRPLEGEELARLIRGNQSLDLARHDLVADILDLIGPPKKESTRPTARARKRSAS